MYFESDGIINEETPENDLRIYYVGFDLGEYRNEPFVDLIMDTIVDFAYGYHTGILKSYNRRILKEAARSIYKIKEYSEVKKIYIDDDSEILDCELEIPKKYLKRGEFGEMILHLLLRDFFHTVPLLSKIYFKDTDGGVVHGFDLVHIGNNPLDPSQKTLFLGESKIYARKAGNAGIMGVQDLIKDIKEHFNKDFLYREIALIGKKRNSYLDLNKYKDLNTRKEYEEFLNEKEEWFEKLKLVESKRAKLEDFLSSVTIPLVCTYQSNIFNGDINSLNTDFMNEYRNEMEELKVEFNSKLAQFHLHPGTPDPSKLNIILLLFPIPNKKQFVKSMHRKLIAEQQ